MAGVSSVADTAHTQQNGPNISNAASAKTARHFSADATPHIIAYFRHTSVLDYFPFDDQRLSRRHVTHEVAATPCIRLRASRPLRQIPPPIYFAGLLASPSNFLHDASFLLHCFKKLPAIRLTPPLLAHHALMGIQATMRARIAYQATCYTALRCRSIIAHWQRLTSVTSASTCRWVYAPL